MSRCAATRWSAKSPIQCRCYSLSALGLQRTPVHRGFAQRRGRGASGRLPRLVRALRLQRGTARRNARLRSDRGNAQRGCPTDCGHAVESQLRVRTTESAALVVVAAIVLANRASAPLAQAHSGSIVLPLSEHSQWQVLHYRSLPPHRVRFLSAGLEMAVDGSAMPLIHPFAQRLRVSAVRVEGRVEGALR